MRHPRTWCVLATGFALGLGPAGWAAPSSIRWTILDAVSATPVPCRVHLRDARGQAVLPPALPTWRDHFVCDGHVELELPAGEYAYELERGPEYGVASGRFSVGTDRALSLTNTLRRLVRLADEGWWSGETHVHRPLRAIELLMRAEDLHVAEAITWWNDANPWARQTPPANPVVRFDGDRFYDVLAGEDERGGGALLYFGLPQPLPLAGAQREHPSPVTFLREARRRAADAGPAAAPLWVDLEKPFWWDTPIWLATGLVDSVGLAHNHLQRGGMLDNEAWGKPRDRAQYPPAWGNGLWTQDLYYRILNAGLRLPPSAGSASGVLPNPVGYNRAYVHVDGELTYAKWWAGLRAGRVFVSNGPLLRVRANGQWPGAVFRQSAPLTVRFALELDSREPIRALELVHNGRVTPLPASREITLDASGWFLVRALADVTNTFRFASTGPWYAELGDVARPVRREAAQFFLEWVRERKARLNVVLTNAAQRAEVLTPVLEAETFWQAKVAEAEAGSAVELVRDPCFARGFTVLAARAQDGPRGRIRIEGVTNAPVWELAQWHSRFELADATGAAAAGYAVSNVAKWLGLERGPAAPGTLTLGVDSRPEYNGHLRRSAAEPWVHLLVQQAVVGCPSLAELAALPLRCEARLREAETFRPEGHSPGLHAAQFQVVLTLNNTQPASPGFGDYLWFVVPLYDDRYAVPPEYVAQDFAVTGGKLIYNPGGAPFATRPVRAGGWVTIAGDLRPWLERALAAAWARGYLRDSRDRADYRIAHLNLGWEVPGLNRVAMDLRGLSLRAVR